ncbi:peptidase S8/S53 domain-containing protein [Trichoderma sp. TUCIM 5745]
MKYTDPKLLKLSTLAYTMEDSTTDDSNITNYLEYLNLKQTPGILRKLLSGIQSLNRKLATEMNKKEPDRSAIPRLNSAPKTPLSPAPWLQTAFSPSFWSSSRNLFNALVRNVTPCTASKHSAMLHLQGLKPPEPQDNHAEFNILLPCCSEQDIWQETFCHILYKTPSKVDASESDSEEELSSENICQAVQIANDYSVILHIRLHSEDFRYYCDDVPLRYPEARPTITVSELIDSGLLKDLRVFHLKDRWTLAVNLAQCLLQLHDGPWLQTLWTSDNIFLLCETPKEGRKLRDVHSPFISSVISENPPNLPKPTHFDRYPLLLSFGQFLLELANGEKLPIAKTKTGEYSPYKTLKDNFIEINTGSLSDDYKDAIEGCLKFQKFIKDEKEANEEVRIRTTIFKKIVQPLERNLRLFSKDIILNNTGIVKVGDRKDILLTSPQTSRPQPPKISPPSNGGRAENSQIANSEHSNYQVLILNPLSSHKGYESHHKAELHQLITIPAKDHTLLHFPRTEIKAQLYQEVTTVATQQSHSNCRQLVNSDTGSSSESEFESTKDEGTLFGTFDTRDSGAQEFTSLQWGRTFRTLSRTYNDYFQYTQSDGCVKVAIFDTGIDQNHLDFLYPRSKLRSSGKISSIKGEELQIDRIKACQNFCDDRSSVDDVTDIDGHGTHVAGIILQLAPTTELYIARICQGDANYGDSSKQMISAAPLKQSVTDKKVYPGRVERAIEWAIEHKVHVINMSFGYKHWDQKLDQALKKARDHGIIIFAAASNFGNHEQVSWPARDSDRTICVHSSIDFGTGSSEFTPKAHPDTTNFMVVGEEICSHWPESKGGGFRTMTGTSTATPVAAAIAALLIAFTRQGVSDKERRKEVEEDIGPVRLDDLSNMRALLKHISIETNGYYWINPRLLWGQFSPTKIQEDPGAASKYAWEEIRRALRR